MRCVWLSCILLSIMAPRAASGEDPARGAVRATDSVDTPSRAAALAAIKKLGGSVRPIRGRVGEWEIGFHLRGRKLDDKGLTHLAALKNVVSLNLRHTRITNKGLLHLRGLKKLRWLHLERTRVGDDGTEHLAKLENLEYLNLYETKITDRALAHLVGLKKLRRVYVWRTGVTDQGVDRLEKALPGLKVVRGVDLSQFPTYTELESITPEPKIDLEWIEVDDADRVPKSKSGVNTQVFFENKSGARVKLIWIGYGGELKFYALLDPGAKRQQNSYEGNTWLITDENDKALGYFLVAAEVSRAVIPRQE